MDQKAKISGTQVATILFVFVTSTITIYVPGYTANAAKESAWLAASMLPFLFGYLILLVINKLGISYPKLTFFQYSEVILGKVLGKGLGLAYILFLLVMDVLVLREFSDFLMITTLPLTPKLVLLSCMVALATYGAYKGLEVIIRAVQFILSIYLLGFMFTILLAFTNFQIGRLFPIMEAGLLPIIRGSLAPASWYGELYILAILFPFVNKPAEIKRKGLLSLVAITLFVTIDVVITLGVFGANFSSALILPFWSVTRSIEIGEIFQRLESFLLVIWITGIIIKATLLSFLICLGITQVFGLKDTKIGLVLGSTAALELLIANSLLGNASQVNTILSRYWPPFAMPFELVIPALLLGIKYLKMYFGETKKDTS